MVLELRDITDNLNACEVDLMSPPDSQILDCTQIEEINSEWRLRTPSSGSYRAGENMLRCREYHGQSVMGYVLLKIRRIL